MLVDGNAMRSCVVPVSPRSRARRSSRSKASGTPSKPHPLQKAFIDEQAVQCGYCINGMIMQAAALLQTNRKPSEEQIQDGAGRKPVPLRNSPADRARDQARIRDRRLRTAMMRTTRFERRGSNVARRDFLKTGGALVVTLRHRRRHGRRRRWRRQQRQPRPCPRTRSTASSRSTRKGNVTVYSGKVDLGTGIQTAMTQIAAEELSVPLER